METIYLGGYTRQDNQGIHASQFDSESGQFGESQLIVAVENPTYFDFNADQTSLFTLAVINDQAGVAHYKKTTQSWYQVDFEPVWESNGCYLSYDQERQLIYLANYGLGELAVVQVDEQGHMSHLQTIKHTDPTGPHENQDHAHAHYIQASHKHPYVFSCDLGTDQVHTYQVNADKQLSQVAVYHTEPGTGPRHLVEHPSLNILYILGELSYTIDIVAVQADGQLISIDRIDTMPDSWTGFNSSAAIRLSDDGQYLYVSNRGPNQISTFSVSADGQVLSQLQTLASGGDFPRDFNFNASQDYIICGHQHENQISVFKRNRKSGLLSRIDDSLALNEIVCIK
ncbi:6-phosphogluconolactonase [Aerococcus urinaehominis]|uniref:6-phosphogluconolactonase n=1 Tax=Aerococcus urinaehominis TaxID=128944 RepID=A0A0X8FKJ4_9LACT|nr:lactonase family protein [Aerococcus urinaehominis]AMB98764.1 6-phosphogluconolactonase [Aerococcus urinaehominis]SDM13574.1 6-phosphogluconolactonase [Aerococcus urinaehominis]